MPINFDKALGSHENALLLQSRRTSILASNIANADTPGYKARDMDFSQALKKAKLNTNSPASLKTTHAAHFPSVSKGVFSEVEMNYRTPSQSSLDGNTVELQKEQAAFAENAVRYQATLKFLGGKFKGIRAALRGE